MCQLFQIPFNPLRLLYQSIKPHCTLYSPFLRIPSTCDITDGLMTLPFQTQLLDATDTHQVKAEQKQKHNRKFLFGFADCSR